MRLPQIPQLLALLASFPFFLLSLSAAEPAAGWVPVYGRWELEEGKLSVRSTQPGGDAGRGSQNPGAIALFGKPAWKDYKVGLVINGNTDVFHLLLRARNDRNCIQFGRDGLHYSLVVFKNGEAISKARKELGPIQCPEKISAEIRGNVFKGYRNGELVVEHTFSPDEIAPTGKAGLQTNHGGSKVFDQLETEVFQANETRPAIRQITIDSAKLSANFCGRQRLMVQIRNSAGLEDVVAVSCEVKTASGEPLPLNALRLERRSSPTSGIWETPFFSLCEGTHELKVRLVDGDDQVQEKAFTVDLTARPGSFVTVGNKKIFENIDPHPAWRPFTAEEEPHGHKRLSNYLWLLDWEGTRIACRALTIEPEQAGKEYVGRKIVPDESLEIRPRLLTSDGKEITGPITRRLAEPSTLFGLQPTFEMVTPAGKLTWWVRVFNGDPILRFGGTFVPEKSIELSCSYEVKNGYLATEQVAAADNFVAWRPGGRPEGPVFAWTSNKKAVSKDRFTFAPARLQRGQAYELPMLALGVVDSHVPYSKLNEATTRWAAQLAHLALAVPRTEAACQDVESKPGQHRLALGRTYEFLQNDWRLSNPGQLMALPWCTGTQSATGEFHTAFGRRPYLVTKEKWATVDLPLPDLAKEKLVPDYQPLAGDWKRAAQECIEDLLPLQNEDGTFRNHDRMDQYWLGRMTMGLMLAYRGFEEHSPTREKIATMVRKGLVRMLGEQSSVLRDQTTLRKQFGAGVEETSWNKGESYRPFVYSPQWNVFTEMGGMVDQNLGHAHLMYTLLLYAAYLDPAYVTKPEIRAKIEEMIKFQWLSQDWNGDIWRVYVGGIDAAGGGDGFEEDLALVLPYLAEQAGLDPAWRSLSSRISAMKFGALRHFDYLPVNNEWGYEFLTPIHHVADWMPEGGWKRSYLGDVWLTGPAVCSGIYGPWYSESVYRPIPDVFSKMWYDLLEDPRDTIPSDDRHWLTIGGYCAEAQISDPFLGAVKLLRAYEIAKKRSFIGPKTRGDALWNMAFYPAAMTLIQHELRKAHPFMKEAQLVCGAAISSDPDQAPAYAWKETQGAVISVAAHRIKATTKALITVDGAKLGLWGTEWELTDLKTGQKRKAAANEPLQIEVAPRSATTLRVTSAVR